jgi:hypothetical protein
MGRFGLACRAFWAALRGGETAQRIEAALAPPALPKKDTEALPQPQPVEPRPAAAARSEAITLLAALQRESRLVDLVKQPLEQFSDEQVGAAARTVLTEAANVLDRFFALVPVVAQQEGTTLQLPAGYDPGLYKVSGVVSGSGPLRGQLVHHGWKATMVKLPTWTGSREAALVVAPAEVEVEGAALGLPPGDGAPPAQARPGA